MNVYAPLIGFPWDGENFVLEPGLEICRLRERPELRGLDEYLTFEEELAVTAAKHWLCFDWDGASSPSPAQTANLVLMSLWLAKPTKTHMVVRFEIVADRESSDNGRRCRLLDRVNWVPGHTDHRVDRADLENARSQELLDLLDRGQDNEREARFLQLQAGSNWRVSPSLY